MIKKLRKKLVTYTIVSVFSLLVVILAVINVTNFVMVAEQADNIAQSIKKNDGEMPPANPGENPGPMKPDSPENLASIRYFTFSEEESDFTYYNLQPDKKEEFLSLAKKLLNNGAKKGWTNIVYRYRVYKKADVRYVVLLDQSRELIPSYRILLVSSISAIVGLGIIVALTFLASKKLIQPIEDSDTKQRRFIADAAIALKTPVSVISIDNATLTNEHGEEPANKSIRKQVEKLLDLAEDLNALTIASEVRLDRQQFNLSNVLKDVINQYHYAFKDNGKELVLDIQDDVVFAGDDGMFKKMLSEIIENSLKYSDHQATITLKSENERISLEFKNDAKGIPEGSLDRVFEKFYRLDYKDHSQYDGSGVGLSIVKEIVERHGGRIIARGENDMFILKIEL